MRVDLAWNANISAGSPSASVSPSHAARCGEPRAEGRRRACSGARSMSENVTLFMMGSLAGDTADGGHIHHSDKSGQTGIDLSQVRPFPG
jgi:hypothetical protein